MCGILGVFGPQPMDQASFISMLDSLGHRGPDHTGMISGDGFALGHQRLSILDLEGGHQPLAHRDRQLHIVCNGEIYNFRQLRERIPYDFATLGDSEVLLPLYSRHGSKMVSALDGMFSFILSDGAHAFAARDPLGIKPLYYGTAKDHLFLSSEIKALINCAERIFLFPPGHCYHSVHGFLPYYQLRLPEVSIRDESTALNRIREVLRQSVRKRLMADVPVGVFLSGGLDSSIIAALMKEEVKDLHSFSVGLEGAPDLEAARKVAAHLGTHHHEYVYTMAEMLETLTKVIYHLESCDPALIRSAVPCYFVSRLAASQVKVVLSGEGADELFAGYSYMEGYDDPSLLQRECLRILQGLHHLNLQRVDRMTMAHGLEGRVPFLDVEFIETVLKIEPTLRFSRAEGLEKGLLRRAFADLLPREVAYRPKQEFAQGAGSSTGLADHAEMEVTDAEFEQARREDPQIGSKEALFYKRIFKKQFNHPDALGLSGQWQGTLH